MATYTYVIPPIMQFLNAGVPVSGGKLFTYIAGTTTKQATYADNLGATPLPNPIILDTQGRPTTNGSTVTPIFGTVGQSYKFVLSNSTDTDPPTSPIWTADNEVIPDTLNITAYASIASSTLSLINTQLVDPNGKTALTVSAGNANAVNYVNIQDAATGSGVQVQALGSDSNINISLLAKGTGTAFAVGSKFTSVAAGGQAAFNVNNSSTYVNNYDVIGGATGIAPVLSAQGSDSNINALIRAKGTGIVDIQQPVFNCQLSVASTTSLQLTPYNGNRLFINGANYIIPSGGITISNAGLGASTVYYTYCYNNSGTLTLELSTTAPAIDTTYGHKIKNGDATRILVGMIATNGSSQFSDIITARQCLSWYNRVCKLGTASFTATRTSVNTGALAEINTEIRVLFLSWNEEYALICAGGATSQSNQGATITTGITVDTTIYDPTVYTTAPQATDFAPTTISNINIGQLTEAAIHTATIVGGVSANTGTWVGGATGTAGRFTLTVAIKG